MKFLNEIFKKIKYRVDSGDSIDRVNYEYTPMIITAVAIVLFGSLFAGGRPIQCWVPAQFTGTWEKYAETYCYVKNTYYHPLHQPFDKDLSKREGKEIGYYQWVPIILGFQAVLFMLPNIFWRILNYQSEQLLKMNDLVGELVSQLKHRVDGGDSLNRLHYQYTPILLAAFSMTLLAKQYVGNPVQCWIPAEFHDSWEAYAEAYCFVKNTYFLPLSSNVPHNFAERESSEINYYQWVPILLLLQALLFYAPAIFTEFWSNQTGLNVKGILKAVSSVRKDITKGTRTSNVKLVANHILEALDLQKDLKPKGRFLGFLFYGAHYGFYVTGVYLLTKILYLINVVGQLYLMNSFLGTKYDYWGFGILRDLIQGVEWSESTHFPRVTMCDFKIRVLGNIHNWTIQCVLMINMFNEKIYIFLWWWFLMLAILTALSMVYWFFAAIVGSQQRVFVEKYLRIYGLVNSPPKKGEEALLEEFVKKTLRHDGVFIMRMIAGNTGDLVTGDLIAEMYSSFLEKQEKIDGEGSEGFTEEGALLDDTQEEIKQ